MVRCFVAIELPEEVKAELKAVEERFKKGRMDFLRWVDTESIHLTLKFLGEVPDETVAGLGTAIEDAVSGVGTFELELTGLGVFPSLHSPRVFWAGIGGQVEVLKLLQQNVEVAFGLLGFEEEGREFKPHLTLARVRDDATVMQRKTLGDLVARSSLHVKPRFTVRKVNLMRSQLKPSGAVYTCLAAAPLVTQ